MAAKKATKKAPKKPGTKKRRGVKLEPTGLGPEELPIAEPGEDLAKLEEEVRADGGAVIGAYREPLGGHTLLFAALPVEKVAPTPFQRDVSDAHVRKLTVAMDKTRRFLDPIIVVREDGKYLTPNGNHRLTAMRELGARSIVALVVPERAVAYQILALNIEKAHNLRERALEVVRMYRDLARFSTESESAYQLEFEEPGLVTLGFAYEGRPRLSGGAYNPVLRKVDKWIDEPIADAAKERERRAGLVLTLDEAVAEAVERFKEKGLTSPYLKTFVVARINPLRFIKGEPPPLDELMATMTKRAKGLDPGKVRPEDLARSGGAPDEE
ncbi:MAG TPA: ParB N-terminal domain-containing protein [Polyangiaceae bacterium]|nr:ParB N-terminal domain-containing protein [Polyangiaceae bacterium]